MAYSRITWVNDNSPAINANNLNRMEEGIDDSQNAKCRLDTTAASGTTDGDLTASLTALGWLNDVVE